MDISSLLKDAEALAAGVNITDLVAVASAAVNALPAIEAGIMSAMPYIQALQLVLSGGTPTAEDWAALDARLDAGSAALQAAAALPDPNA